MTQIDSRAAVLEVFRLASPGGTPLLNDVVN